MINDNVTEMLDLGQAPKRRGRPATGKAMSAAEKQKLYRQRLKERNVTENQNKTIEDMQAQIEALKEQLAKALATRNVTKIKRHRDDNVLEKIRDTIREELERENHPIGERYARAVGAVQGLLKHNRIE